MIKATTKAIQIIEELIKSFLIHKNYEMPIKSIKFKIHHMLRVWQSIVLFNIRPFPLCRNNTIRWCDQINTIF